MKTGLKTINIIFKFNAFLILNLSLNACQEKSKENDSQFAKKKIVEKQINVSPSTDINDYDKRRDDISFFGIDIIEAEKEGDTVGFVSVSDIDRLPQSEESQSGFIDSLIIPDLSDTEPSKTRFFLLTSKYRNRLLKDTKISEKDSLFIYDYNKDTLVKFSIKNLNAVANLTPYDDPLNVPHSVSDYMLGFKIDLKYLTKLSYHTFVYIGNKNPFVRGKMQPILWRKIDNNRFPSVKLSSNNLKQLKGHKLTGTYKFEWNQYKYYLQQFTKGKFTAYGPPVWIVVLDGNNEQIFNTLYTSDDEDISGPVEINIFGVKPEYRSQWTGQLLKGKPPVIFGFHTQDFGCGIIDYLDKSRKFIDLNCDNRH